MPTGTYWRRRMEVLEQRRHDKTEEYLRMAEKQFRRAQADIEKEIAIWYERLSENNEISLTAAYRLLRKDELEEFHWTVEEYIKKGETLKYSDDWKAQLENASVKVHIKRLEALKLQIQQQCELLYGSLNESTDRMLRDIYKDQYYRTAFEIQKGTGVGYAFNRLDARRVQNAVDMAWARDGKNFSSRIWQDKEHLVNSLNDVLTQNIIRGENPRKAIERLAKKMDTSKNNAGRLYMTESAAIASRGQQQCYRELGVEEFEFVCTLDSHTSEICRRMDGMHFPMTQYEIGVTAPPMHPYCRSVTVPYFPDDEAMGKRAARGEDGKTYYVPADMTYEEWQRTFVDNGDKSGLRETGVDDIIDLIEKATGAKCKTPFSVADAVSGANPNYSRGLEYRMNCQRCVQAYELRRRGYDVIAKSRPSENNTITWGTECFISHGKYPSPREAFSLGLTKTDLEREFKEAPDGARYAVYVKWKGKNTGAHVFIAEKDNDKILYLDPQTGKQDVEYYLNQAQNKKFGLFRMDDKEITSNLSIICNTVEVRSNDRN